MFLFIPFFLVLLDLDAFGAVPKKHQNLEIFGVRYVLSYCDILPG
jgi:hypothetical protein